MFVCLPPPPPPPPFLWFMVCGLWFVVCVFQILVYCRSSCLPHYQWPSAATHKAFTLDVIYLHDKPGPHNCPQKVFDALVDALDHMSEYEGYIFECGQGSRLFRHMSTLLAHPQQRCPQDKLDIPKILARRSAEPEAGPSPAAAEEGATMPPPSSSQ